MKLDLSSTRLGLLLLGGALVAQLAACQKSSSKESSARTTSRTQGAIRPPLDGVGDLVLGQPSFDLNGTNSAQVDGLHQPTNIAYDTTTSPPRVYVSDTANNRVLGWSSATALASGAPANVVIGFTSSDRTSLGGGGSGCPVTPSDRDLCQPRGLAVDTSGHLYVADTGNNRVLRFFTPFTTDGIADGLRGQSIYTGNACSLSGSGLCRPSAVAIDTVGNIYVSDSGNARVLRYPVGSAGANLVFGQIDGAKNAPNLVEQAGLNTPRGIAVDRSVTPNRLWVVDSANHRVLGFTNAAAFASGQAAAMVLGQVNYTNYTPAFASPSTFNWPTDVTVDSAGNIFVVDSNNHRVIGFANPWDATVIPGKSGDAVGDKVFGQGGWGASPQGTDAQKFRRPMGAFVSSAGHLYVADTGNNRVVRIDSALTDDTAMDAVYGQADFLVGNCNRGNPTAAANTLCEPTDVVVDSSENVIVADTLNHRTLVFTSASGDTTADQVIGQPDLTGAFCNQGQSTPSASTLCNPSYLALDSTNRLWIGDGNGRVLGYDNAIATSDFVADHVLGRPDMTGTKCSGASATCFNGTSDTISLAVDENDHLLAGIAAQHRVLRFDSPALLLDYGADAVLGQSQLDADAANLANGQAFQNPTSLFIDGSNRMFVSDPDLNRVLVFTGVNALANNANAGTAAFVIGQTNLFGVSPNGGGISASTLRAPGQVTTDSSGNYYVADVGNNRVLRFDTPFAPGGNMVADAVYGQADFVSSSCNKNGGVSDSTLCGAEGVVAAPDGTAIWVADTANHRVLKFNSPSSDFVADVVLGQSAMDRNSANIASMSHLNNPSSIAIDKSVSPGRVVVADRKNNRVLGWPNMAALTNGAPATLLLGQTDSAKAQCNLGLAAPTASTLCDPQDVRFDSAGRLWVADSGNNRVVMFLDPFNTDTAADFVVGQADFVSGLSNQGGTASNTTLSEPRSIDLDSSGNLFVSDAGNHRVLMYLNPYGTSNAAADKLLGQADYTSSLCNRGGLIQPFSNTLCGPRSVRLDKTVNPNSLYVADADNGRVLRFDDAVGGDTTPDQLVGQLTYTTQRAPVLGAQFLYNPTGLGVDHLGNLYVAESSTGSRVLVFNQPRTTDTVAGDVFGQNAYDRNACNQGLLVSQSLLCEPTAVDFDEYGGLWIADRGNNRVLTMQANTLPVISGFSVSPALPSTDSTLTAVYTYSDADGDPSTGTVLRWFRDGSEVTSLLNTATVPATETARGQVWHFTVVPHDGIQVGNTFTASAVTIQNTPPVASNLVLSPANPSTSVALTADYDFADADLDSDSGTRTRWYRNNVEQAAYRDLPEVPASATTKNDVWTFTIEPSDGLGFGTIVSSLPIQIGNTPPVAQLPAVSPAAPKATDFLTATYLFLDDDSDAPLAPIVQWYRNGTHQAALDGLVTIQGPFTRTDQWHFTLVPRDGTDSGALVTSAPVTIESTAPNASALQITPGAPGTDQNLTANYLYSDLDGQPESGSEIKWYRNGAEQVGLANQSVVTASVTSRGETWHFTVSPRDNGGETGTLRTSPSVVIVNTLPEASLAAVSPAQPVTTDDLTISYTYTDDDSDVRQAPAVRWFRNGVEQLALANQETVLASETSKRDVWLYRIRPNDGIGYGAEISSTPVFIQNTAPVANAGSDLAPTPTGALTTVALDGSASSDVDGDLLSYTWSEDGSTLATGVNANVNLSVGLHTLTLTVNDGEASHTDTLVVDLGDPTPTVTVEADKTVEPGIVTLSGTASDLGARTLSYAWTQISGDPVVITDANTLNAKFFGVKDGVRTFQLVATVSQNGSAASAPAQVSVTMNNQAPVASLVKRQVVQVGVASDLDGRSSQDPNADSLTYAWTVAAGPGASTLTAQDQPVASFTAQSEGVYQVQVAVNDGTVSSAPAVMEVVAIDPSVSHVPVANAGEDRFAVTSDKVTLDGAASYDVDGDALTYVWRVVSGGELALTTKGSQVSFTPSQAGDYVLGLVVRDAQGDSTEDQITVNVGSHLAQPKAIVSTAAGESEVGSWVELSGTRSTDPNGVALTYTWTQVDGIVVPVLNASSNTLSVLPLRPGQAKFRLTVSNGTQTSAPADITLRFRGINNSAPTSNAGPDRAYLIGTGPYTLDASSSSDTNGDTLRYVWEQVSGPAVALSSLGATPTFNPKGYGTYVFRMTAWDEGPGAAAEVRIKIQSHAAGADNHAPRAILVAPETAAVNEAIALDGAGSQDEDPLDVSRLSYKWSIVGFPTGAEPQLAVNGSASTFTAPKAGVYTVSLIVSDGDLNSAPAHATIQVGGKTSQGGCSTAGGDLSWMWLGLALVAVAQRRRFVR